MSRIDDSSTNNDFILLEIKKHDLFKKGMCEEQTRLQVVMVFTLKYNIQRDAPHAPQNIDILSKF